MSVIDGMAILFTGLNLLVGCRVFLATKSALKRAIDVENLHTEARAYREDTKTRMEDFSSYVDRWYEDREAWLREHTRLTTDSRYPGPQENPPAGIPQPNGQSEVGK